MPLVEPETVARGEVETSPAEAAPQAYLDGVSVRSRRLLRAVEHYRAASVARGEQPDEEELWLVLLAALDREPAPSLGNEAPANE